MQHQHQSPNILLLYHTNHDTHGYNASYLRSDANVVTLKLLRRYLSLGFGEGEEDHGEDGHAKGFHYRVRMEEHPDPRKDGIGGAFSYWDIQDENAKLPVQNMTYGQVMEAYFGSNSWMHSRESSKKDSGSSSSSSNMKSAKQAFKGLTKAISEVTSSVQQTMENGGSSNPFDQMPMRVIVIQVIDLSVLRRKYHMVGSSYTASSSSFNRYQQQSSGSAASHSVPVAPPASSNVQEGNLMDFGNSPAATHQSRKVPQPSPATHRPQSVPTSRVNPRRPAAQSMPKKNETRAEKLQREYKKSASQQERVWDEVDQRWVVKGVENGAATSVTAPSASVVQGSSKSSTPVKGISIDAANAIGKSAVVQQAVHARVNEMKKAQDQALAELREREKKAKEDEEAEDVVRRKLEPKIKAWSEEHGKKKQLRALLASLQIILWPEAGWKAVNIGDILDDKKARRCYLKATLKVHPDKTKDLDAEKRFIAKRVFDALSQAFTEFEGKK